MPAREEEMADLSGEHASRLGSAELYAAFLRVVDVEGKIPAATEALGPVSYRDVVVLEAGGGVRVRQLVDLGARVTALVPPGQAAPDRTGAVIVPGTPDASGLRDGCADVVVSFWSAFLGPDARQLAEADRILRPGGRLLIVHDYGRDDVCQLWPEAFAQQIEWSRRNGPFLANAFRIRVIHCWWSFESMSEAERLLTEAFGQAGADLAARIKRPRLEYNIAIYHRSKASLEGL